MPSMVSYFRYIIFATRNWKLSGFPNTFGRDFFTISNPLYSKNTLRRIPIRVLNNKGQPLPTTTNLINDNKRLPSMQSQSLMRRDRNQMKTPVPENRMIMKYEKITDFEDKFSYILTLVKCKEERDLHGRVLLEGVRLINDALDAGAKPDLILFSQEKILSRLQIKDPEDMKLYKVFYKMLKVWSSLKTCPGIMGVFKKPHGEEVKARSNAALPVTIICHNIQDSGKLGSIVRSSAAVGCKAVIVMKDCVDVWMHKVLRSGCGAQFRIPIISDIEWIHILNYIPRNSSVFLINSAKSSKNAEDHGFFSYIDEDDKDEDEDSPKRYFTETEKNEKLIVDEKYEDWYDLQKYVEVPLPSTLYTNVKFPKNDIVLVISDDTLPVDLKAIKLGCEVGAKQLNIPFENSVQRISSPFSLAVVLYEIRRQMIEKYIM